MSRLILYSVLLFATHVAVAAEKDPPKPMPAEEVARKMQLPPGFKVTVFAAEPDVVQPMAMTFDDRGRLWVVECLSYPDWIAPGGKIVRDNKFVVPQDPNRAKGHDRITIFEDTDGDGKHDKRTVFYDKGVNFTGIEYGFGGVFVTAPPYLLFIPDKNRDDKPDGPPQILLEGWDLKAKHNAVNCLTWGPDGWLYGCNGILSNSEVRVVTPTSRARQEADKSKRKRAANPLPDGRGSSKRTKMNCGVWRYHPTRRVFEVVAHGTTNPWGLDFNADGEMFITNCVIKHVFHVIPGGHYKRMFGQDITPNVYGLMPSCADHIHWGGGKWTSSRGGTGIHDKPGGGHAHAGCMIYLGDNWPAKYRGNLFTCNIHGRRVNMDVLSRRGSGYVATHGPDFLKVPDPWFRGLQLKYGPDGGVYLTDWSDTGECHDYNDIHRENGRIYKITYGDVKPWRGDIAKSSNWDLLAHLSHPNHWQRRHALRLYQERLFNGIPFEGLRTFPIYASSSMYHLWSDHIGGSAKRRYRFKNPKDEKLAKEISKLVAANQRNNSILHGIEKEPESERAWLIRLHLFEKKASPKLIEELVQLANKDKSPIVRLALASGLQRLPVKDRWGIAEALVAHAEDAKDANIPLMIWYGIEPAVSADRTRAIALLKKTKIPLLRQYIVRRLAETAK